MATYQSSDLLTLFNSYAARPSAGDQISDANKYLRLARAQHVVIDDFAARIPEPQFSLAAYGSTPTLTTSDNQIFTFGTDLNSDASFPLGKVNIYNSLSAIPDYPLVEGQDYLWEGSQIRIPNNGTWVGTLYWRGVAPVQEISASVQPTIVPPPARILIVLEAARAFMAEGGRSPDKVQSLAAEYGVNLARWLLALKTANMTRGGTGALSGLRLTMANNR